MKFRCERDVLVDALGIAGRAATTRNSLPVLSGIRVELEGDRLSATGSDLDRLTITRATQVAGLEDGTAVLPAKLAVDIVRSFEPGAVTVETTGEGSVVSGGRSTFTLPAMAADEYPTPRVTTGESVTLPAAELAEGLRQVVRAASRDDTRRMLTGVLMTAESDSLRLVSTDSYRLAVRDLPRTDALREGQRVLVPWQALDEVGRLLDGGDEVTLVLGEHDVAFDLQDLRVSTRLIEDDFPDYAKLIPDTSPESLIVSRQAFIDALKRVKLVALEHTPVRLELRSDFLRLGIKSSEVGSAEEEVDAKYSGPELEVAFNPEYLLQGLEVTTGDEVMLETDNPSKPAMLRSVERSDFLYLLMPVRVS